MPAEIIAREIQIGGRSFTVRSDDRYLANMGDVFEPDMTDLFGRLIEPQHRVLDVGANIGCTALLFGQLAARVLAVEPSPTTFRHLQSNVLESGLRNVEVKNVGLGTADDELTLTFSPDNRSGGFVSDKVQACGGHTVEKIAIRNGDALLRHERFDFIKIDVEGFELQVIHGLKDLIARSRPVVVLEMNHWCLNVFQRTTLPDFIETLLDVFPILYAVEQSERADLRDPDQRFVVMHQHVTAWRWANLVGAFDHEQIARLSAI
jgi:FkbM family methyltransferase